MGWHLQESKANQEFDSQFLILGRKFVRTTYAGSGLPQCRFLQNNCQDHGNGGLSLRGVAVMTVLAVLTFLALFSYRLLDKEHMS